MHRHLELQETTNPRLYKTYTGIRVTNGNTMVTTWAAAHSDQTELQVTYLIPGDLVIRSQKFRTVCGDLYSVCCLDLDLDLDR